MKTSKFQITFILSILLILGFVITSLTSYHSARLSLSEQISESSLPLTSSNVLSEIHQDLLKSISISSLMASNTFARDWVINGEIDETKIVRYLSEIQRRFKTATSFFISAESQKYYHSSGVKKIISIDDPHDDWYWDFMDNGEEYEINVSFDSSNPGDFIVYINYRTNDYLGRMIGVTGVGLSLDRVYERINILQRQYGRQISFVNREGIITLSSNESIRGKSIRSMPGLDKIATQILSSPNGAYNYEQDGNVILLNVRLIDEFDWYLLIEQDENSVSAKIFYSLVTNLMISLSICLAVIVLTYLTLSRYQDKLEEMATTDKLTGAANRHIFETLYDQVSKTTKRNLQPLSMAIIDIDHFKKVNDSFGHNAGDATLKSIVSLIHDRVRKSDTIFRWGGEEFLILLPDCNARYAKKTCETIRKSVEEHVISHDDQEISATISIGVGEKQEDESAVLLIKRVDESLYKAKENGRNQVQMSYPSP